MLVKSLLPFVLAALAVNAAPVDKKAPSDVPAKPSPPSPIDVVSHVGGSNKSANKEKHPMNLPFGPRNETEAPEPKKDLSPLPVDPSSKVDTLKSHAPRDDEDAETEAAKKRPASKKPASPLPVDPVSTVKSHAPRDDGEIEAKKPARPSHGSGGAPTKKLPVDPVAMVAPRDDAETSASKSKKPSKKPSSPTNKLPINPIDKVGEVKSHAPRDDGESDAEKKPSKKPSKDNDKSAMPQLPPPQVAQAVSPASSAFKSAPKGDESVSVQLPPAQVKQTVSHNPRDDAEAENKKKSKQHQAAPLSPAEHVVDTVQKNAPVH